MYDLGISLVVYKTSPVQLLSLFQNVSQISLRFSFTVVDNFGDQELEKACQAYNFAYIRVGRNIGFGAAHNLVLKENLGRVKYHLVLNPDISFTSDTISKLFEFMNAMTDVACVLPRIEYPDGSVQRVAKLLPTPANLILRRFLPSFMEPLFRNMDRRYELWQESEKELYEAPSLSGCFMFLRDQVLVSLGLFDERFFMYLEDVDLSRRISAKYRTVCLQTVKVIHGFSKGSYKNLRLLLIHIRSAISYFNKWGWFIDQNRKIINRKFSLQNKNKD